MKSFLQVENLSKSFGDKVLFSDVTFGIYEGDKIGLIAKNGAGKTTLLRIVAGAEAYDSGEVTYRNGLRVAYLAQLPELDGQLPVADACMSLGGEAVEAVREYEAATASGDSKWVTGEESRRMVHELRSACMGILVGAGTVAADDPMLNCRLEGNYRQPVRIVVDTGANISLERRLVTTAHDYKTIVAYVEASDRMHLQRLEEQGVELMQCKAWEGKVDVWNLLEQLGRQGIDSLLFHNPHTVFCDHFLQHSATSSFHLQKFNHPHRQQQQPQYQDQGQHGMQYFPHFWIQLPWLYIKF